MPPTLVDVPEVHDPVLNTSTSITAADKIPEYYPFMFVLPDGKLFMAGPGEGISGQLDEVDEDAESAKVQTYTLDLSPSSDPWTPLGVSSWKLYGLHRSAVMFRPGMVLKCGGYHPDETQNCLVRAETGIIKFVDDEGHFESSPNWTPHSDPILMNFARKDHSLVLLPDGRVVVIGGSASCSGQDCDECEDAMTTAEWIDPNLDPP